MTPLLVALFLGAAGGFLSSAPIGPINLWIASAAIERVTHRGVVPAFVLGVVFADGVLAALALIGYAGVLQGTAWMRALTATGGIALVVIGIAQLRNASSPRDIGSSGATLTAAPAFLAGAAACAANPAFLGFWLVYVSATQGTMDIESGVAVSLAFLVGVAAGDAVWFVTLVRIAHWAQSRVGTRPLAMTRRIAAVIVIAAGATALFRAA